jgi:hypothetical protein
MRDQDERRRTPQDAFQALAQVFRVQGGKAFVQQQHLGSLQQGACQEYSTTLALGRPPTGIADELIEPGARLVHTDAAADQGRFSALADH